jgi:hypothetical protein
MARHIEGMDLEEPPLPREPPAEAPDAETLVMLLALLTARPPAP